MISLLEQLGGQAAGVGMGLLLEDHNDKRQQRQQQALQQQQIKGAKEMADYNWQKQYDMWKATNYGAQVKELEAAGLNPGLLYGMGGSGGATTGSPGGSMPSSGEAPKGGGETLAAAGMGLQLQTMQAQIKLMEAQAEKTEVEAEKIGGVDTEQTKMTTEKTFQEWQNLRQTHSLQELEKTMKNIENFEKQTSQANRLNYIEYQTKTALHELNIVKNENKISDETIQSQINKIKSDAIGSVLKNILTQSQTTKTISDTWLNDYKAKGIYEGLLIDWEKLSNQNRELRVKEALKDWTTDPNREAIQQALGAINTIVNAAKRGTTIYNVYE